MAWTVRRISYLVEALAFAALVAWYIWWMQATAAVWSWAVLVVWVAASLLVRQDTPKTLGWRADNLWRSTRRAVWFFVPAVVLLCGAGLVLGMRQRVPEHFVHPRQFAGYLAFCLMQQVALNSYLTNRLLAAFENSLTAAVVSGGIFAVLHWPNPVLVPLTLVGGVAMAWLFARERNILPLAIGQAILGALVWWAFPMAWHHSMRVGPGYGTFHL